MGDYISRQDALDAFNRAVQDVGILDADDIETVFGMLSPADVVQVAHGEWGIVANNHFVGYRCSICKRLNSFSTDYCPNCGAKMVAQGEE